MDTKEHMKSVVILLILLSGCSDYVDHRGKSCSKWDGLKLDISTDNGVCYRECMLAAVKSEQPYSNSNYCINQLCSYKRVCP